MLTCNHYRLCHFKTKDAHELAVHKQTHTIEDTLKASPSKRNQSGQRNSNAKLTLEKVKEMRRLNEQGVDYDTLSEIFGITYEQVRRIVKHQAWG